MNEDKITAVIIEDNNIEGLIELEKLRGPNGFSAYELYLKNLPEGEEPLSELEWVNSISKVNYYKQYYQNYRTTIDNESDVPIELENFNETCVLNVYLNGFRLRDDEYLIDYENKKLVLKNPISKNQDVSLFMLKTAVVTSDNFDLLKGEKGDIGLSNTLTIGTVEDGDVADAMITGVSPNQILNLVLPKGKIGDQGPKGEPGTGVPSGGTSGQVLAKKTDSDNDTEWIDPPATGGGLGGDTSPVGTVYLWYSDTIPDNYLLCNGQAVSRVDYDELFNLWGTMYGSGNGSTTFNVPDLRDYVPIGKSDDVNLNEIGKKYGEKTHLLTVEEMPSHTHTAKAKAGAQAGNNAYLIDAGGSGSFGVNNNTGGDQAHNNMQPSIATNFIVKAYQKTPVEGAIIDSVDGNSSTDAPSVRAVNNAFNKNVFDMTLKQDSNHVTIPCDILHDGGAYELLCIGRLVSGKSDIFLRLNNNDENIYYQSGFNYNFTATTTDGQASVWQGYRPAKTGFYVGMNWCGDNICRNIAKYNIFLLKENDYPLISSVINRSFSGSSIDGQSSCQSSKAFENITSIDLFPDNGNGSFAAGTRFILTKI